jgi:phage gpG-like protein
MAGISSSLNAQELIDGLARLERVSQNPQGAFPAIGAHFVFSTQRNIEHETSPDGKRWARLSPRTAAKRVGKGRRGFDHMLRVTNRLYQSVSYNVLPDGVEWGSNLVYARVHQLGGVIDMPARRGSVTLKRVRQKGGGIRSRFARTGAKGGELREVSIRGHQVRIPARPYLGISAFDREEVTEIIADHIRQETLR